jgi:ABC-2 type transport system permease protein
MIKTIVRKEIQVLLKEKGTFFWLFLLPILFILMFASIFSNAASSIPVNYYDTDQTAQSKDLIGILQKIPGFELKTDSSLPIEEQIQKIKDGKTSSLLIIPSGYGALQADKKQVQLQLYRDATADTEVAPILAVLHNVSSEFREGKLHGSLIASGKNEAEITEMLLPPVTITEIKENATKMDAITQYVPGYTTMFVFFIIITMVRNFLKDKDSGMLARLRSTPMKPYHYLVGMWVPNILVVMIQCTVLLTFGKLVYNLHLGDMLAIAAIVIGLAVCSTGIGLALSMLVRSENQGTAFTQIITMGGAIIGGLWFPYDFMPAFAQAAGKFSPQYWAQHGFQDVMVRGAHISDIWMTFVVLLSFGAVGLLVASLRFKRFLHSATD